ncbi:hypothetical protein K3495_g4281 [Podosphaera aphanis]|nr:hypothetical protein K3495_g4281 [Podosphaera aphanis]
MDETNAVIDDITNGYAPMSQQDIDYLPNHGLETINLMIEPFALSGFTQDLSILE